MEEMDLLSDIEKRKRAPNFTRKEQRLLDELVKVYAEHIYIKSTSSAANAIKAKAWQELANDFNKHMGSSNTQRMPEQLKLRWENERKKLSREARRKNSTNSSRTSDENDLSRDKGVSDDEDASNHNDESQNYMGTMKLEDDEDDQIEGDVLGDSDFKEQIRIHITNSKVNGVDDSEKADDAVNMPFEQQSTHSISNGLDETETFEMLQKRCFLQEHKLRLLQMQQKHGLELDCIKAEHKARVRMMQEEHLKKIKLLEFEKSEGPHSILADDEFYDAIESGLDKMEEEQELRERLISGQMIPITPPPVSPAEQHKLWPEIDRVVKQQVAMAKMGIGECGTGWQLFAEDGEMKMYRREEEIDGFVCDPLKAVHVVKGITGHEVCHYFFHPNYRYDWETTLEHMTITETISDDTLIFHQIHKRIWPASQRDVVFWSHMRYLSNDQDRDGPDMWTVVNNSTEITSNPANQGKCVRIYLTVCLLCQTKVTPPKDGTNVTRDDVSCKITYCSKVNPGGWAPASVLRAVYKREYPKFLKRFTAYVKNQTKNKPLMF